MLRNKKESSEMHCGLMMTLMITRSSYWIEPNFMFCFLKAHAHDLIPFIMLSAACQDNTPADAMEKASAGILEFNHAMDEK